MILPKPLAGSPTSSCCRTAKQPTQLALTSTSAVCPVHYYDTLIYNMASIPMAFPRSTVDVPTWRTCHHPHRGIIGQPPHRLHHTYASLEEVPGHFLFTMHSPATCSTSPHFSWTLWVSQHTGLTPTRKASLTAPQALKLPRLQRRPTRLPCTFLLQRRSSTCETAVTR